MTRVHKQKVTSNDPKNEQMWQAMTKNWANMTSNDPKIDKNTLSKKFVLPDLANFAKIMEVISARSNNSILFLWHIQEFIVRIFWIFRHFLLFGAFFARLAGSSRGRATKFEANFVRPDPFSLSWSEILEQIGRIRAGSWTEKCTKKCFQCLKFCDFLRHFVYFGFELNWPDLVGAQVGSSSLSWSNSSSKWSWSFLLLLSTMLFSITSSVLMVISSSKPAWSGFY